MAIGDISAVVDTLEFETTRGREPDIFHISGDVFAVVYSDNSFNGQILTVTIDTSGNISAVAIDIMEFNSGGDVSDPHVIHVSGNIYAIVHDDSTAYVITTVNIDASGNIGVAPIDTFSAPAATAALPKIINVGTDMFAVTYTETTSTRSIAVDTIGIDSSGNIDAAITDGPFLIENGVSTLTPSKDIINISGTMYAVTYTGDGSDGFIATLAIATDGTIAVAITNSLEFETVNCHFPKILNISGDVYVISYIDFSFSRGTAKTLSITSVGAISAVIDTLLWRTAATDAPSFTRVGTSDIYIAAIQSTDSNGFAITFNIDSSGNFSAVLQTLEFETAQFGSGTGQPSGMISVGDAGAICVVYEGPDGDGFAKTFTVQLGVGVRIFPTDPITRVTNIIHRYVRRENVYTLELSLGEVTSDFGLPQWLSKPQPAIAKTTEEIIADRQRRAAGESSLIAIQEQLNALGNAGPPVLPTFTSEREAIERTMAIEGPLEVEPTQGVGEGGGSSAVPRSAGPPSLFRRRTTPLLNVARRILGRVRITPRRGGGSPFDEGMGSA